MNRTNLLMESKNSNYLLKDPTPIWKRRRYFIAFMAFLGYFNIYTMRSNLSVAIVSMTRNHSIISDNGEILYEQYFSWDSKEKGYILSSFFYGYICTQILSGALALVIGGNILFGLGIFFTSIFTLLGPLAANLGLYAFIASRISIGVFEGVTIPALYQMYSKWVPPHERTRIISIAQSGTYVGESPAKDHFISLSEKSFIEQSLSQDLNSNRKKNIPWLSILTSTPLWANLIANFTGGWGVYTLQTQLPQFVYDTLNYNIKDSGLVSALPYICLAFMMIVAGTLIDWVIIKGYLTKPQTRKIFGCSALLINMICIFLAAFFVHPVISVALITIGMSVMSFGYLTVNPNIFDLAPQFSGVLIAFANTLATISGMISPVVTGFIVTDGTEQQWKIVFYITAGAYFVGALVFWIWCKADIQPWAKENEVENENKNNVL